MTSRQIEQQIRKLSAALKKGKHDFINVLPYPPEKWKYSIDIFDNCVIAQKTTADINYGGIRTKKTTVDIDIEIVISDSGFIYFRCFVADKKNFTQYNDYIGLTRPFKYYDKVRQLWQELCSA